MKHKRVTLFAGHYGSGKTNIAVNYALLLAREGKRAAIAVPVDAMRRLAGKLRATATGTAS